MAELENRTGPGHQGALGRPLYDAHNHLHDQRLAPYLDKIMPALKAENVVQMVVNGSSEEDWPAVLELARRYPQIVPSFGYHPWYVQQREPYWLDRLQYYLDQVPSGIGEIGLDRWLRKRNDLEQEEVFLAQWRWAAQHNRPASIHCLQAWGRLLEILECERGPACGFLLHSFGGPVEMVPRLAELGAYFSIPGYFALAHKVRQRETFRHVPFERLLIETDAPDQHLPPERVQYPLADSRTGKPLNHPANLRAVYQFVSELLDKPIEDLARQIEENFLRLFEFAVASKT